MPRYIIERTYLMPVCKQFVVEAPDLETACREAMDEHKYDWDGQVDDPESSESHHLTRIVRLEDGEVPDITALYDGNHDSLDIPREFAEPGRRATRRHSRTQRLRQDRLLIDGDDLDQLRRLAGFAEAQS